MNDETWCTKDIMMQQWEKDEWRRQALLLPGRSGSLTFNPISYRQVIKIKGAAITTLVLVTVSFVYRNPQAHLFLSL